MGLYQMVAAHTLGYKPQLELVTGMAKYKLSKLPTGANHSKIDSILQLRKQPQAPLRPSAGPNVGPVYLKMFAGTQP